MSLTSPSSPTAPAPLHVIYAQHDLTASLDGEGSGVNKPVVRKRRIIEALEEVAAVQQKAEAGVTLPAVTFDPLTTPASSLKPTERIHAPGLIELFSSGWDRWMAMAPPTRDLYFTTSGRVSNPDYSELVPSQAAPRDEVQRAGNTIHSQVNYYAQDRTTPITKDTSLILHHDLAVTLKAVEAVLAGEHRQVYACTTQPGHHSGPESYGGYCYINQACLAADLLQEKLGKVALLDVDYHAGNGSMAIFYRNPHVFMASIHADPDVSYPYCSGYADQVGAGEAVGSTLNVPLPKDCEWAEYSVALKSTLERIKEFGAQALVVSLGVDTIADDPEACTVGGFKLRQPDYVHMGQLIRSLDVPTIWVQEGGYKLDEAGEIVRRVLVGNLPEDKDE